MKDRVALVTGANAGLGLQLSLLLARQGAHVIMACRSAQRAEAARAKLLAEVPAGKATLLPLDVSEPASIRECARRFDKEIGRLDVLIHNAGIFGVPASRSSAGHELHFATNHLGPFALTGLLLPCFRDEVGSRIVTVGSLSNRFGKLDLQQLALDEVNYSPWRAYARSKLALLTFTLELNRRLEERGSQIAALSAHPGFAPTDIAKHHSVANRKSAIGKWFTEWSRRKLPTVEQCAQPILHAACAEGAKGGESYGPGGFLQISGPPVKIRIPARARDRALAERLWSTSESLTGVRYLSEDAPR